jgi:DNA primase
VTARLSLAAITAFDPGGGRGTRERRSCCPFCGTGKPIDMAHRSLTVNVAEGVYVCHRCGAAGQLDDAPRGRAFKTARTARFRALARDLAPRPMQTTPDLAETASRVRERLSGSVPIAGSPGEAYLRRRGLADIGPEHDVKYHPAFFGRRAIVFAVRNELGAVVAVHGRMLDAGAPKALTIGPKRHGVYATSRDVLRDSLALAVVEAPLDALSVAAVGIPAIALLGTTFPTWLRRRVLGKSVLIATDDDAAGEKAADALRAALDPFGAHCVRVRFGADKDANAFLCAHGEERLIEHLLAADTPA